VKIKNKTKNKIKLTREKKGFKQIEIANKTYISVRALQNYEASEREPLVHTAIALAEALEVKTFEEFKDLFGNTQRQLRETSFNKNTQKNSTTKN